MFQAIAHLTLDLVFISGLGEEHKVHAQRRLREAHAFSRKRMGNPIMCDWTTNRVGDVKSHRPRTGAESCIDFIWGYSEILRLWDCNLSRQLNMVIMGHISQCRVGNHIITMHELIV